MVAIRFSVAADQLSEGEQVEGTVKFHDGETANVSGVLRLRGEDQAVVMNLTGITFTRIMAEQRYLTRKYPGFGQS